MKKISKTIAMVLILVMLAGSFTCCISSMIIFGEIPDSLNISNVSGEGALALLVLSPFILIADIALIPVALVVVAVRAGIESARNERGNRYDSIDTFSAVIISLSEAELNSLMQAFDSLPEEELASLVQRFYSLPEEEFDSFTETVNSFSDKEFAAIVAAFNNLSEAEIISSLETLNSMPQEIFVAALDNLQHIKFRYQF